MPTLSVYLSDEKYLKLIKLAEKTKIAPAKKASSLLNDLLK